MTTTTLTITTGSISITGSGLIATSSSGTGTATSADAYRIRQVKKLYFEWTANVWVNGNTLLGFGTAGAPFSAGNATLQVGVASGGTIKNDGVSTGVSLSAGSAGDVVCCAIDFEQDLYWFRRNAGNWNNSATASPADARGGLIYSLGYVTPICNLGATSEQATLNAGATTFAQAVPTGFTGSWDTPGNPTALLSSQDGIEAWYQANSSDSPLVVSHIGLEVFRSTADAFSSSLIYSQVGAEVWASSTDRPSHRNMTLLGAG